MPLLIFLQGSMWEEKKPSLTRTSPPASSMLPYALVAAATFQNYPFWGVTARLELLSKTLGKTHGKEEAVASTLVFRASPLHHQNQ